MVLQKYLQIDKISTFTNYLERINLYANKLFSTVFILLNIAIALQFLNI